MLRIVRGIAVAKPGEVEAGQWSMAEIGIRFAGPYQLVRLVEAGVVVQRLGRGIADRLDRPAQATCSPGKTCRRRLLLIRGRLGIYSPQ